MLVNTSRTEFTSEKDILNEVMQNMKFKDIRQFCSEIDRISEFRIISLNKAADHKKMISAAFCLRK
jgi:ribosomal protein S20